MTVVRMVQLSESHWLRTAALFKAHHWLELWICTTGVDMMKMFFIFAVVTCGSAVKQNLLKQSKGPLHIITDLTVQNFTLFSVDCTL